MIISSVTEPVIEISRHLHGALLEHIILIISGRGRGYHVCGGLFNGEEDTGVVQGRDYSVFRGRGRVRGVSSLSVSRGQLLLVVDLMQGVEEPSL